MASDEDPEVVDLWGTAWERVKVMVEPLRSSSRTLGPFEALGDSNRREILRLLSDGDKPVQVIADSMSISRPAVSRHLRRLKDAGLVSEEARGTRRIYHLQDQGIVAVRQYLEGIWGDAASRFRLFAENSVERGPR